MKNNSEDIKQCRKCGLTVIGKEIKLYFYPHKKSSDGYRGSCKECGKKESSNYYNNNSEKCKNVQRIWVKNHRDISNKSKRKYCYNNKEKYEEWHKDYNRKHPDRIKAYAIFAYAKHIGKIIPFPCNICGSTKNVEGHHSDYSKPLNVIWLCSSHHKYLHKGAIL